VVVLLEGDDGLVAAVDADVLRLGVLGGDRGQAGERHPADGPGLRPAGQVDHGQPAAGRLRELAVVDVLVTLVLDGHGGGAPVGGEVDRVRLPAQVVAGHHLAAAQVDHLEDAGRVGERRRGVDHRQDQVAGHVHRGRFAWEGDRARRPWPAAGSSIAGRRSPAVATVNDRRTCRVALPLVDRSKWDPEPVEGAMSPILAVLRNS
jgi:hypothetical protein